ncbi:MAG TPA: EAL domain-containing protein [Allosphingosinicella sp.]|jgi:EAL domain-containing protein (putative c-di-GMP-specific phosphodiesterase class I)/CHASE2 domain-containing sensor protein
MLIRIADLFQRRGGVFILALALLAGIAAATGGWSVPLEHRLEELRHSLFRKPPSGETVVVGIDGRSLNELGNWPWPRSTHGRIVDALREAGARQIVFDVGFAAEAPDPRDDAAFAAAIRRAAGRVVLPALLENGDGEFGQRTEVLPISPLRDQARIGAIWLKLDDDLFARNLPYSVQIGGARRPSLATILADRPSDRPETIPLDWSFDPAAFRIVGYSDVLAGRFEPGFFRNRNVIIGATASTLGDRFLAPSNGRIPGVFIQAIGSETLRRHNPRPIGEWPAFAAACLLIGLATLLRRPMLRFAALGSTFVAACVVPLLLREYTGVIAAPGAAVMAALVAALTSAAAGVTAAVIARVTLAPVSQLPNLTAMCISAPGPAITVAVRLRNHVETTALLGASGQGELLRRVADRIRLAASGAAVFQVDDHSFAWRTTDAESATSDALEGLHALLASGITVGERTVDVTIAVGISDDPALGTEEAVAAAMAAASRADRRGLSWTRYEADDDDDADWRLSLLNELDRAIDQGDVWVAYQPKCDLKSATICGAEALVRWRHPLRGEIRPDQFIPMLEDNGRIEKLTLHVLESAIRDFAPLDEALSVAINISARMIGRNRLSDPIREMLDRWGMDAHRLTLEITESAALAGSAGIEELNNLRAIGVHISIDDYGTGQSTLSYLKTLPATELKIDRSFVQVIATSRSDAAVVDSTVKLAHALGLIVVAEGVESEEVLNLLRQMNCDMVQGYYIGEPGSIRTFIDRLSMPNPLRAGRRR